MKKILSLVLAMMVSVSCISFAAAAEPVYVPTETVAQSTSVVTQELPTEEMTDLARYQYSLATELKSLGLFKGVSDTEFDLGRAPTRVEALVMLIRLLGSEDAALNGTFRHSFTDVPDWANKYVGYAYQSGLTNGQSVTEFGSGDANAAMFLTFVLRALGYSDANGADFTWDNPYALAEAVGIIDNKVNLVNFKRGDSVIVMHKALSSKVKGTDTTLAQKLIYQMVFTKGNFIKYYGKAEYGPRNVLTNEQIATKCNPAVIQLFSYDKNGELLSSGSGFFIDSYGNALTNFHVISNEYKPVASMKAKLYGANELIDVVGVYDFFRDDWAVIKLDCTDTPFLRFGNRASYSAGSPVAVIGYPGGSYSYTAGIISNPDATFREQDVIQIDVAVNHGNSGGALVNKYGEVIGIPTWGLAEYDRENMNYCVKLSSLEDYSLEHLYSFDNYLIGIIVGLPADAGRQLYAAGVLAYALLRDENVVFDDNDNPILIREYPGNGDMIRFTLRIDMENDGTEYFIATYEVDIAQDEEGYSSAYKLELRLNIDSQDYSSSYYAVRKLGSAEISSLATASGKVSDISKDGTYTFTTYGGNSNFKEGDLECALLLHLELIGELDDLFEEYDSNYWVGLYSMKDFGYTSYDSKLVAYFSKSEEAYPLFYVVSEDESSREWDGITLDLCKGIAKELGREFDGQIISDFSTSVNQLQNGEGDIGAIPYEKEDDTGKWYKFSVPYYTTEVSMLVPADSTIKTTNDLAGKRVGVRRGSFAEALVSKLNLRGMQIVYINSALESYPALGKNIDVYIENVDVVKMIVNDPFEGYGFREVSIPGQNVTEFVFYFNSGNTEVIEAANKVITTWREDGTLGYLLFKHYFNLWDD